MSIAVGISGNEHVNYHKAYGIGLMKYMIGNNYNLYNLTNLVELQH